MDSKESKSVLFVVSRTAKTVGCALILKTSHTVKKIVPEQETPE